MDRFAKQFGARVKLARTGRGLTQAQLAALASVGANYVPRIERGEMTPSVDAAFRLAQALGVSVDELCSADGHRDPTEEGVRAVVSLTEQEIGAFRRVVKAVDQMRSALRTPQPRRGDEVEEPAMPT